MGVYDTLNYNFEHYNDKFGFFGNKFKFFDFIINSLLDKNSLPYVTNLEKCFVLFWKFIIIPLQLQNSQNHEACWLYTILTDLWKMVAITRSSTYYSCGKILNAKEWRKYLIGWDNILNNLWLFITTKNSCTKLHLKCLFKTRITFK